MLGCVWVCLGGLGFVRQVSGRESVFLGVLGCVRIGLAVFRVLGCVKVCFWVY